MCNNQDNLIVQSDFACIGEIAVHCDLKKLCVAISEAQLFDIEPMLCQFWTGASAIIKQITAYQAAVAACEANPQCTTPPEEPTDYGLKLNLVCGGTFSGCDTIESSHLGLKRIIAYYAYSRYLVINGFNDTPAGTVSKTNEFSIPKPLAEVKDFADKYRSMAFTSLKKTMSFICANKNTFTTATCSCGKCKRETTAVGYGSNSSVIRKNTIIRRNYGGM